MEKKKKSVLCTVAGILMITQAILRFVIPNMIRPKLQFWSGYKVDLLIIIIATGLIGLFIIFDKKIFVIISMLLHIAIDIYFAILSVKSYLKYTGLSGENECFWSYEPPVWCYISSTFAAVIIIFVVLKWYKKNTLVYPTVVFVLMMVLPTVLYYKNKNYIGLRLKGCADYGLSLYGIAYLISLIIKVIAYTLLTIRFSFVYKNNDDDKQGTLNLTGFCAKCGSKNKEKALFCDKCGSPITYAVYSKICSKCKYENEDEANNCIQCGTSLTKYIQKKSFQKKSINIKPFIAPACIVAVSFMVLAMIRMIEISSNKMSKIYDGMNAKDIHSIMGQPNFAGYDTAGERYETYGNVYFAGVNGVLRVTYTEGDEVIDDIAWSCYLTEKDTLADRVRMERKIKNYLKSTCIKSDSWWEYDIWEGRDGDYILCIDDWLYLNEGKKGYSIKEGEEIEISYYPD